MPTIAIKSPKHPAISPFKGLCPERVAAKITPIKHIRASSQLPSLSAMAAAKGRRVYNISFPKASPKPELTVTIPIASLALPFRARGKPSRHVATEAGVPGILIIIAVIPPA